MARRASRGMDDETIRLRLNRLLKQYTRAEIARKTGASSVNVGRYARGTQIPAAFCAALVRKLGVNATWLLLGEGAPDLKGINADPVREQDILKLIESMNAVARLEIGALGGDDHARMLRELSEALATRDRLQKRLSEHGRTLLENLLKEIHASIQNQDFKKAGDLRRLAAQVGRIGTDPELEIALWEQEARVEAVQGRPDNSLELYRRVTHQIIARGKLLSPETAAKLSGYCHALRQSGRTVEALRVYDAIQALAGPELLDSTEWSVLQGGRANNLLDAGRLREACETLHKWIPRSTGFRREFQCTQLQAAMILAGGMRVEDAMVIPPRLHSKGLWMVFLAVLQENPALMRSAADYLYTVEEENGVDHMEWSTRARVFADLIEGRKNPKAAETIKQIETQLSESADNPAAQVGLGTMLTLHARHASGRAVACRHLRKTHALLKETELPNVDVWVQALHAKNALLLVKEGGKDEPIRKWAEALIEHYIKAGFGMFQNLVG